MTFVEGIVLTNYVGCYVVVALRDTLLGFMNPTVVSTGKLRISLRKPLGRLS